MTALETEVKDFKTEIKTEMTDFKTELFQKIDILGMKFEIAKRKWHDNCHNSRT